MVISVSLSAILTARRHGRHAVLVEETARHLLNDSIVGGDLLMQFIGSLDHILGCAGLIELRSGRMA